MCPSRSRWSPRSRREHFIIQVWAASTVRRAPVGPSVVSPVPPATPGMGKGGKKGKEERRAKKAAANKERSRKSVRRGAALDRSQVVSFSASLKAAGLLLYEARSPRARRWARTAVPAERGGLRRSRATVTASSARSPTSSSRTSTCTTNSARCRLSCHGPRPLLAHRTARPLRVAAARNL